MARKSIELRDEQGRLTSEYRQVLDKGGPKLSKDDKEKLAKMDQRLDELADEITMHEKQESRELAGVLPADPQSRREAIGPQNESTGGRKLSGGVRASKEYDEAVLHYMRTGKMRGGLSATVQNALQADSDTAGGYLTMSEQLANRIIEKVDNQTFFRSSLGCTITTLTTAGSLGIPSRDHDVDDAVWSTELTTGDVDTGLKFGKRELRPHPIAKKILLSKKLIRLKPDIIDYVLKRLAYKIATPQEVAFLMGSGVEQPLGVFTPSANGISTSRDIPTGSATGFAAQNGADVLFDALYSLKAQYQSRSSWIFHRNIVRLIRKLKDLEGRYLWQPGLQDGQPARILDRPYFMSEYAPNVLTTGKYIGIIGAFEYFEIVDALDMEVQRLDELYSETNEVGFHVRAESDGMPVLEEAFARIVLS